MHIFISRNIIGKQTERDFQDHLFLLQTSRTQFFCASLNPATAGVSNIEPHKHLLLQGENHPLLSGRNFYIWPKWECLLGVKRGGVLHLPLQSILPTEKHWLLKTAQKKVYVPPTNFPSQGLSKDLLRTEVQLLSEPTVA